MFPYKHVVICGGSGKRLWPLSRENFPKPLLKLFGDTSLFQQTLLRHPNCSEHSIVTNENLFYQSHYQSNQLNLSKTISYLLENTGRNTAPAILLAALDAKDDEILVVTPADHHISPLDQYQETLQNACKLASTTNTIILIGIKPTYPSTQYGYIHKDDTVTNRFTEKPDQETADAYIKDGNYVWNSGIFCFKASTLKEIVQTVEPTFYEALTQLYAQKDNKNTVDLTSVPAESFDRFILEKTTHLTVIPSTFQWTDMGHFDDVFSEIDNKTPTISVQSQNTSAFSDSGKTICFHDVEDIYVVDTNDAIVVGKKGTSNHVTKVVEALETQNPSLLQHSNTVYRPWGHYIILHEMGSYKVKKIVINPQHRLSLQSHEHRSEHWTCIEGKINVVNGDKTVALSPNDSIYIHKKTPHRIENNTDEVAAIIEVQYGDYLGEDDIVRIDSDY